MTKENRLEDRIASVDQERPTLFESFNIGRINLKDLASSLWYIEELKAIHSMVCNGDINAAKQHFYTCGLLDEYLINKFDERILDYGMDHISYTLLSDSMPIIKRYALLTHRQFMLMVEQGYSTPIYILQQIILENWDKVDWGINIMNQKTLKKNKALTSDRDFYEGILNKDDNKVIESLSQLLKDHKKRNKYKPLINDFISIPALGYMKIAWLKGMEIKIEHPLIPMSLIPYQPLEKYDIKYDLLNH